MANHAKFSEVKDSIYKGLSNLDKWYGKINDTDAYFICLGKSSQTRLYDRSDLILRLNILL